MAAKGASGLRPEIASGGIFIDTNVLIYTSFPELPLSPVARRRMNQLRDEHSSFWTSRQVLREFLAVATRPGTLKNSEHTEVLDAARLWEEQLTVAEDDAQVMAHLLALLESPGARGKQVHDANVAATMQRYKIPFLLTHNLADFERYAAHLTVLPLIV